MDEPEGADEPATPPGGGERSGSRRRRRPAVVVLAVGVVLAVVVVASRPGGERPGGDPATPPARAPGSIPAAAGGEAPLHVVLVVVDTLRADALGAYGGDPATTPRLDALAARGIRFERAIAPSGWTLPSVATLLTGVWPTVHGATGKVSRLTPVRPEIATAAQLFRDAGHRTLAFANAAFLSPALGLARGFDVYDHEHAYNDSLRRADATVDAALAALAAAPERRTFLLVHLFDPHLDYDPPAGFGPGGGPAGRGEGLAPPIGWHAVKALEGEGGARPPSPAEIERIRAAYLGEVRFVDAQIGRLVDGLERLGTGDRTLLVVTADHGEELWDHGGFEHGHTLYDELVRVPLIVVPPGSRAASPAAGRPPAVGRAVNAQVRTVDVLPTLLEAAGIAVPPGTQGASLWPLVAGDADEADEAYADRDAFGESTLYGNELVAWRTGRWTYVLDLHPEATVRDRLFDRRDDPREREDVVGRHPLVAARLRGDVVSFLEDLKERAQGLSRPAPLDLSPEAHDAELATQLESLRALGYLRGGDETAGADGASPGTTASPEDGEHAP